MSVPGDNLPTAAKVLADVISLMLLCFAMGTAFGILIDRALR